MLTGGAIASGGATLGAVTGGVVACGVATGAGTGGGATCANRGVATSDPPASAPIRRATERPETAKGDAVIKSGLPLLDMVPLGKCAPSAPSYPTPS